MKTLETVNYFLKNYFLKLFISYDFRCAPAWESSKYIIYTWYWLIMGFLLPLVIIIYANFKTVQCLKKVGIITIRIFFLHSDMFFISIQLFFFKGLFFIDILLPGRFFRSMGQVNTYTFFAVAKLEKLPSQMENMNKCSVLLRQIWYFVTKIVLT